MKQQQARIEQLETELIQVKLELEQLQDKHDKVVLAKTKSLDKQQAAMVQNTALQDEIAELRGQLQIKNAQVEDLNQLASTRREEKKQLQGRLLAMQQIRADLIEQNEAKQVNIDQLVGRLTVQGEENKELVKEVEQLKQELACTQENIAELVRAGPTIHQPTAAPASPDNEPTQPPTQDSIVDRAAYDALHQAYESLELNYHSAKDSVKELATKLQCTEIKVDVLSVHLKQAKEEYEFLANEIMSSRNVSLVALPSLQLISMIKLYNP